jgi:hypothetical protein
MEFIFSIFTLIKKIYAKYIDNTKASTIIILRSIFLVKEAKNNEYVIKKRFFNNNLMNVYNIQFKNTVDHSFYLKCSRISP